MTLAHIYLDRLTEIAAKAGEAVMRFYNKEVLVHEKVDGTPLTEADLASERVIHEHLCRLDPSIPYLSEESTPKSYSERQDWQRFWLVDPLDGTKEFLSQVDEFTVNIALIDRGEPVLGVIAAPALGVCYFAAKEYGAWKKFDGQSPKRMVSRVADPKKTLRVVESRSHPSPELEVFLKDYEVSERLKVGSSLKFCLLADGVVDIYPRFGPTMEWDVGAGDCIYRYSAECKPHSSPLTYNKSSLKNNGFVLGLPPGTYLLQK